MTVPPDQPYPNPNQGQPSQGGPDPAQGQPYPPAGQPYPPAGQPYPAAGQQYPPVGQPSYPPAGQPYPGQPFPAAGQPYPPAGQPYPAPGQPGPAPAQGKNFFQSVAFRVLAVVVIVGLAVGLFIVNRSGSVASAEVGDCVSITGTANNPDEKKIDCTDDSANFVVTQTEGASRDTCDEGESIFTLNGDEDSSSGQNVCLRPNVDAGECFDESPSGDAIPSVVPCSSTGVGVYKVAQVLTGTTDDSGCPADSLGWVLPKRSVVYCVTAP